jgi:hypothetical protein
LNDFISHVGLFRALREEVADDLPRFNVCTILLNANYHVEGARDRLNGRAPTISKCWPV